MPPKPPQPPRPRDSRSASAEAIARARAYGVLGFQQQLIIDGNPAFQSVLPAILSYEPRDDDQGAGLNVFELRLHAQQVTGAFGHLRNVPDAFRYGISIGHGRAAWDGPAGLLQGSPAPLRPMPQCGILTRFAGTRCRVALRLGPGEAELPTAWLVRASLAVLPANADLRAAVLDYVQLDVSQDESGENRIPLGAREVRFIGEDPATGIEFEDGTGTDVLITTLGAVSDWTAIDVRWDHWESSVEGVTALFR